VEGLIADMERFSATLINLIKKESSQDEPPSNIRSSQP